MMKFKGNSMRKFVGIGLLLAASFIFETRLSAEQVYDSMAYGTFDFSAYEFRVLGTVNKGFQGYEQLRYGGGIAFNISNFGLEVLYSLGQACHGIHLTPFVRGVLAAWPGALGAADSVISFALQLGAPVDYYLDGEDSMWDIGGSIGVPITFYMSNRNPVSFYISPLNLRVPFYHQLMGERIVTPAFEVQALMGLNFF